MAALIWKNFNEPIAAMKRAMAASMMIIRLFTIDSSLACLVTDVDAASLDQRSSRAGPFRACPPVIRQRRDLVPSGAGKVVLAREHHGNCGERGLASVALFHERCFRA